MQTTVHHPIRPRRQHAMRRATAWALVAMLAFQVPVLLAPSVEAGTQFTGFTVDSLETARQTATFSHTTAAGNERLLVVAVQYRTAIATDIVSNITYGGVALTKADSAYHDTSKDDVTVEVWYQVAPSQGANDVVTTWNAPVEYTLIVANSYTGVDQSNPIASTDTQIGTSVVTDLTFTTTVPQTKIFSAVAITGGSWSVTSSSNTEQRYDTSVGGGTNAITAGGGDTHVQAVGPVTVSWTTSSNKNKDWAAVGIEIVPTNLAPTASDSSESTPMNTAFSSSLSASDPDGDPLTYSIVTPPSKGSLTSFDVNTGAYTYTPTTDASGSDSFTFKVNDSYVDSGTATVSISITGGPNTAPVASSGSLTTNEDTQGSGTLSATDADGDALTYSIVSNGGKGTAVVTDSASGAYTYTPDENATGSDSFTFKANDTVADSNTATITVTIDPVNDAPVASASSESTSEDTAYSSALGATDVDGDSLTYTIVMGPSNGAISGFDSGTGTYTYTPDADFVGSDSFTFKVTDGVLESSVATVSITVTSVNDAPVASASSESTVEDTAFSSSVSATDAEGGSLAYAVVSSPSNGSLSGFDASTGAYTYSPDADFSGSDSFTFKANDGSLDSNTATVDIAVSAVNDAPMAADGSLSTSEDVAKAGTLVASDVDGDTLSYTVVAGPSNGSLSGTLPSFTYTPDADFSGADSFTFKANDGTVDSNTATVSITVSAVNDAPVADAGSLTTDEDITGSGTLTGSDVDGDAITFSIDVQGSKGTVVVSDTSTGEFTYTPDADATGSDSFTFKANDTVADSNTATITVTIDPVNDAPVASDASESTSEDTAYSSTLSASDVDGDSLTYSIVTGPSNGVISGLDAATGAYTYTPDADFSGSDSFTFKANDGSLESNTATVSVSTTGTLSASDTSLTVKEGASGTFTMALGQQPSSTVVLDVSGSDDAQLTVSPSTLTFTTSDWSTPQTVTASSVADGVSDGDVDVTITVAVDRALSSDEFDDAAPSTITAVARDTHDADGDHVRDVDELAMGTDPTTTQTEFNSTSSLTELEFECSGGTTKIKRFTVPSNVTEDEPVAMDFGCYLNTTAGDPRVDVGADLTLVRKSTDPVNNYEVVIPAGTRMDGPGWNGMFQLPTVRDKAVVTAPTVSGSTTSVDAVVEIGFPGSRIDFDTPIKVVLPGQAGKRLGYSHGSGALTEITTVCDSATAPTNVPAGSECRIDSGANATVWSYHATYFASFTATPTADGSVSSGGGGTGGAHVHGVEDPPGSTFGGPDTDSDGPGQDSGQDSDSGTSSGGNFPLTGVLGFFALLAVTVLGAFALTRMAPIQVPMERIIRRPVTSMRRVTQRPRTFLKRAVASTPWQRTLGTLRNAVTATWSTVTRWWLLALAAVRYAGQKVASTTRLTVQWTARRRAVVRSFVVAQKTGQVVAEALLQSMRVVRHVAQRSVHAMAVGTAAATTNLSRIRRATWSTVVPVLRSGRERSLILARAVGTKTQAGLHQSLTVTHATATRFAVATRAVAVRTTTATVGRIRSSCQTLLQGMQTVQPALAALGRRLESLKKATTFGLRIAAWHASRVLRSASWWAVSLGTHAVWRAIPMLQRLVPQKEWIGWQKPLVKSGEAAAFFAALEDQAVEQDGMEVQLTSTQDRFESFEEALSGDGSFDAVSLEDVDVQRFFSESAREEF